MKTVKEIFEECSSLVNDQFAEADASERLHAALGLVDLTMRGVCEAFDQNRWESQHEIDRQSQRAFAPQDDSASGR